jgi:four helix bundle protein
VQRLRPVPVHSFRDLLVWQQSMQLVRDVYELSATLPREERFGLAVQLKRAAVSVPSNIAEGARRRRPLTFRYHLEVALGSQAELEVQIELARELGLIDEARYQKVRQRAEAVGKLLSKLLDSL